MDFRTCKIKNLVKQVRIDYNLIESLKKSSSNKFKSQKMLKLDDTTAGSKISLAYDALRELLEAISLSKGYKIYQHECYTAFLKEIMSESRLGDTFDKFRRTRNDINYYGKNVSASDAKQLIKEMEEFIQLIKSKFF